MKEIEQNSDWYSPFNASRLDKAREQARNKAGKQRRITYDCMNATVLATGRVGCKCGHRFGSHAKEEKEGTLSLLSILRGRSSSACKTCPDYDEEIDTEEMIAIRPLRDIRLNPEFSIA